MNEKEKLFLLTARHIGDTLRTVEYQVQTTLGSTESFTACEKLQAAAEQAGEELFDASQQAISNAMAKAVLPKV